VTTVHTSRTSRVRGAAVVSLLLVGLLSACGISAGGAGQAADVGSTQLPVQTVLDHSQQIADLSSQGTSSQALDTTAVNRVQVAVWVEQQLTVKLAAELGVSVSDAEVDRFLNQVAIQNGTTREAFAKQFAVQPGTWVAPKALDDYARTYLLQQSIGEKLVPTGTAGQRSAALNKELSRIAAVEGVTVSPRFGSWDPATARVTGAADDLSAPARPSAPTLNGGTAPPAQG
jgi:hypothetical protein